MCFVCFVSANKKADGGALSLGLLMKEGKQQPFKTNRWVVREWIALREEMGLYNKLVREVESGDSVAYE